MTLLKCFTLLMFESRLIKEEAQRGRIFTSHVKKRFAVTLFCCTFLTNIAVLFSDLSRRAPYGLFL